MSAAQQKVSVNEELDLFNPDILKRLSIARVEGLQIRPLKSNDYDRGFIQLLAQLTDVGNISREQFLNRFQEMKKSGGYYVVVIEDVNSGNIVASATLVTEQKFIHNCALRGHLEDVVVNKNYRGKHLGKLVVTVVLQLARYFRCYKMSLDCQDRLIPFYESLGFKREPNNANVLNMRFSSDTTVEQSHL